MLPAPPNRARRLSTRSADLTTGGAAGLSFLPQEFPNALDFDTKHTQYHVAHIGTMRCWARTTTVNGTFSQALDLKNFPWCGCLSLRHSLLDARSHAASACCRRRPPLPAAGGRETARLPRPWRRPPAETHAHHRLASFPRVLHTYTAPCFPPPPHTRRDTQTLSIKIQWSDDQTELHVFPSDSRPLLTLAADMGRTLTAWEVVLSSLEFGVHVRKTLGTTFKVRGGRPHSHPSLLGRALRPARALPDWSDTRLAED